MTSKDVIVRFREILLENDSKLKELKEFYSFNKDIEWNFATSDNNLAHRVIITTDNVPLQIQKFYTDCLDLAVNK